MGKYKFSAEQDLIINEKNKNILVSAAAGSGKTTTLIEKCKKIILEDRIPLKNILVLTFTKAAARELKNRLYKDLDSIDNKDEFLKEQLSDIMVSSISTFHGFCNELLKKYFYIVGLDPAFSLIEDSDIKILKDKAYDKLVEYSLEKRDNDFFEILNMFSSKRKDDRFKDSIFRFYQILKNQVNGEKWFKEIIEKSYSENLDNNEAVIYLLENFKININDYIESVLKIKQEANNLGFEKLLPAITDIENNLLKIKDSKSLTDFLKRESLLESESNIIAKNGSEDLIAKLRKIRESYKKDIKDFKEVVDSNDGNFAKEKIKAIKNRIIKFYGFIIKFEELYSQLKKERNVLDFDDLESFTIKLLENTEICETIKQEFSFVIVDEFQDTNYIQEEILQNISKENNRIMVGDVKQSIFKFREAEPKIFIDKYNEYQNKKNSIRVELKENYRSHQNILNFVNMVFEKAMTKDFGGIDYHPNANLVKGGDDYPVDINDLPVKINIIRDDYLTKKPEIEKMQAYNLLMHENEEDEEIEKGRAEGKVVVAEIEKLLGKLIYDGKKKEYAKKVQFKDIVLLASKRLHFDGIIKELDEKGFPYSLDSELDKDIFEDCLMDLLKNFLLLLNNPKQDIPLVIVLKSDLFGFSEEDLAEIRINNREFNFFHEAFFNESKSNSLIANKIRKFLDVYNKFYQLSSYLEVDQLISRFAKETSFENFMYSSEMDNKTIQSYNKLINVLKGKSYNENLARFTESINENKIKATSQALKNSITLSTIHGSKGLEFPIVFVVGTGRMLQANTNQPELYISKKIGIGPFYHDSNARVKHNNVLREACKLEKSISELEESMRLLYVALTRAINYLIIVGIHKPIKSKVLFQPRYANSFLDWISYAIEKKEKYQLSDNSNFELNYLSLTNLISNKNEINTKVPNYLQIEDSVVEKITEIINFEYKYQNLSTKASKTSVSEMLKTEEGNIKKVYYSSDKSSIEKGIAYHKVMQFLDFNVRDKLDIEILLSELVAKRLLDDAEKELIDSEKIINFLKSSTLKEILQSRRLLREQEFLALMDEEGVSDEDQTILQGVVDMICIGQEDIIIVDFKTNNFKTDNDFAKKYKTQLDLYAKAISASFGLPVSRKIIYSFQLSKFIDL